MYCQKCGTDNLEDAKLCQSCGQPISAPPQTPDTKPKTSKLAIWSLILSIVAFPTCLITAIPALICGIWGLVKIRKSKGQLIGTVNAITGIIITIGVVLLALFLPALSKPPKSMANRMVCNSNLASLGRAMMDYINDYNNTYPPTDNWCDLLIKDYNVAPETFCCPGSKVKIGKSTYVFNINAAGKKVLELPLDMVLIFETNTSGWNMAGGKELLSTQNHQGDGCNVLYVDSHTKFEKDPNSLRWTTK